MSRGQAWGPRVHKRLPARHDGRTAPSVFTVWCPECKHVITETRNRTLALTYASTHRDINGLLHVCTVSDGKGWTYTAAPAPAPTRQLQLPGI